ncbi:MAG TPA: hypothetical protein V6D08_05415 [Candidatus Obscuribacterales bacterium]
MGVLGSLVILLAGVFFLSLFLSPDLLGRILKALRWSVPNAPEEKRTVQVVLFIVSFFCFAAVLGFPLTALLAVGYFAFRLLAPSRR